MTVGIPKTNPHTRRRAPALPESYGWLWAVLAVAVVFGPVPIRQAFAEDEFKSPTEHDFGFRASDFFRISDFGFRISNPLLPPPSLIQPAAASPPPPLAPSSRRTGLVISEIMYHPPDRLDGKNLEYLELYNTQGIPEDISGYRVSGDIDYFFPGQTIIPPGGFLVLANSPTDVQSEYGLSAVLGPFGHNLPNDTGVIRLRNRSGAILLEINYDSASPWPAAADGGGHSLVLARPSYGEGHPNAWQPSQNFGGSPGAPEPPSSDPRDAVVINEILAHSDAPNLDYIELYNRAGQEIDLSGCILSDSPNKDLYVFASGTFIPAHGFLALDEFILGFGLAMAGDTLYFRSPAGRRVIDCVRFAPQAREIAWGRFPDGAPGFQELRSSTPLAPNAPLLIRPVVINEIMYAPASGDPADQYIELFNQSTNSVDLGGWRLEGGISFQFPTGTVVWPADYLVVAKNTARLQAKYPRLGPANLAGGFAGALSSRGGRVALMMPHPYGYETNATILYIVADETAYAIGGRWGRWANGGGSSLELIDPRADNRLAANWADSDESLKSPWTDIEVTGVLENGAGAPADTLQILLTGSGECLLERVEVLDNNGRSCLVNSTFANGNQGWHAEGTHAQSAAEPADGGSGQSVFHLRASEAGDTTGNHVWTSLIETLAPGSSATIRARVRWLRGAQAILFRLHGNWLEAVALMPLPPNPGTPGRPNSRAVTNAPPAIYDVNHQPVLPAANQPVLITARAHDSDGITGVAAYYRIDPSAVWTRLDLHSDGTQDGEVPRDGRYTAMLPGQPAGALVAFYLQATDRLGNTAFFPPDAPTRECLIRFGELQPEGTLPTYHLWMTSLTASNWTHRGKQSRQLLNVTFVAGNERAIYGASADYAGGELARTHYDSPMGQPCGYRVVFPPDDPFLGSTELVLDWPGNAAGPDPTALQKQTATWIAARLGIPYGHRSFVRWHVNGVTETQRGVIFESVLWPGPEFLEAWDTGEDEPGSLYNIEPRFERSNETVTLAAPPTLANCTTTNAPSGSKNPACYRWNWRATGAGGVADYADLYRLVDAVTVENPVLFLARIDALVDAQEWMRALAFGQCLNNFESYGHLVGARTFARKPLAGKWQLIPAGLDQVMLLGAGAGFSSTTPLFQCGDPALARLYETPALRRAFWSAVRDLLPCFGGELAQAIDAQYNCLSAQGVTMGAGQPLANPAALQQWLHSRSNFLAAQLPVFPEQLSVAADLIITATNVVTITGGAPLSLEDMYVNIMLPNNSGVWSYCPLTWTSETNWSVKLVVSAPTNEVVLQGWGRDAFFPPANVTIVCTGALNRAQTVVINEWMADNSSAWPDPLDKKFSDWFELYNLSSETVDLEGMILTDSGIEPWRIPSGWTLPPQGFLVVWADGEPEQNIPLSRDLHVPFGLDKGGDALRLFRADGLPLDEIIFGKQKKDKSAGRYPDGTPTSIALPTPTPGAPNIYNARPVLSSIASQTISPGHTLRFQASAMDADFPPQTLTFSLDPGAPAGAHIDSTGLFTWTPEMVQAGQTYNVTLRVIDDGNPPLGAVAAFTVTVLLPVRLNTILSDTAGNLWLSWQANPGRAYSLEYKTRLEDPAWIPFYPMITVSNTLRLISDPSGTNTQRFYRLIESMY